jgi:hypothetical protein
MAAIIVAGTVNQPAPSRIPARRPTADVRRLIQLRGSFIREDPVLPTCTTLFGEGAESIEIVNNHSRKT